MNLAHSASFLSLEKIAPSKSGIKHLVERRLKVAQQDYEARYGKPKR